MREFFAAIYNCRRRSCMIDVAFGRRRRGWSGRRLARGGADQRLLEKQTSGDAEKQQQQQRRPRLAGAQLASSEAPRSACRRHAAALNVSLAGSLSRLRMKLRDSSAETLSLRPLVDCFAGRLLCCCCCCRRCFSRCLCETKALRSGRKEGGRLWAAG